MLGVKLKLQVCYGGWFQFDWPVLFALAGFVVLVLKQIGEPSFLVQHPYLNNHDNSFYKARSASSAFSPVASFQ